MQGACAGRSANQVRTILLATCLAACCALAACGSEAGAVRQPAPATAAPTSSAPEPLTKVKSAVIDAPPESSAPADPATEGSTPDSPVPTTSAPRPPAATEQRYLSDTITSDGTSGYGLSADGERLVVTAPPTNQGGNIRQALVADTADESVDQQSCVTWRGPPHGVTQPGLALRIHTDAGGTRGIVVTNNIWSGVRTTFNVHVVDTQAAHPMVQTGLVVLRTAVGHDIARLRPLPWRMCARAIGTKVDVKVWPTDSTPTEPSWGDRTFVGSTEVPASAVVAGRPGIYIGHLLPGEVTVFSDASTTPLPKPTTRVERQSR